ncbi:MAG: hypothetical protein JW780_07430 [Clostridiales bacterium]|nr:hypothetical protein [Clostridiales bacterium]
MRSILRSAEKNTCVNPLIFSARFGRKKTDMDRLRGFIWKRLLSDCSFKAGSLRIMTVLFRPFVVVALSIRCFAKFSRLVSNTYGIGKARFFFRMLGVCLIHSVTPTQYCRHQFFLRDTTDVEAFLFGNEASILLPQLNDDPRSDSVDDKEKFYGICTKNDLPIPEIFGVAGTEGIPPVLPSEDIVVKPIRGSKGSGIEIWQYQNDSFIGPEGASLDASSLFDKLRVRVQKSGNRLIIQRRLFNHSILSDLSKNALITVRIVTYRDSDGVFRVMNENMILSLGFDSGGIRLAVAPINEETGRLGAAVPYGVIRKEFSAHPVTSAPILNVPVPYREEALSLVLRAHASFPDFFSLGWDIAITDDGPVILEANKVWDAETVQRPNLHPIAQTGFAGAAVAAIRKKSKRNRATGE